MQQTITEISAAMFEILRISHSKTQNLVFNFFKGRFDWKVRQISLNNIATSKNCPSVLNFLDVIYIFM